MKLTTTERAIAINALKLFSHDRNALLSRLCMTDEGKADQALQGLIIKQRDEANQLAKRFAEDFSDDY